MHFRGDSEVFWDIGNGVTDFVASETYFDQKLILVDESKYILYCAHTMCMSNCVHLKPKPVLIINVLIDFYKSCIHIFIIFFDLTKNHKLALFCRYFIQPKCPFARFFTLFSRVFVLC